MNSAIKHGINVRMFTKLILTILVVSFLTSCRSEPKQLVSFQNDDIEYMGRIGETDSYKEIYWSGSSIKLKFEGTSIEAILEDEHGENFFNVIVDGNNISIIQLDSTKEIYEIASELSDTIHTVELFKRTEWTEGKTKFYGFQLNKNANIIEIKSKVRSIEFYGNSITAGYAVEDYSGKDSPEGPNTNNYNSYANITARHFDANYNCIVRSGIGIAVSWFPMIMDEMYYRLDPSDENSLWDFSKYQPDIVAINLFQNDSWIVNMPENDQFKNRFGEKVPTKEFVIDSYRNFVQTIISKYASAKIICMLGNMDITQEGSIWPSYVEEAVSELDDENISTLFIPYKNSEGHPKVEEQKILADGLIQFIENNIEW